MSRILVTGSTDGLGRLAASSLLTTGHDVVVHARNDERAQALGPLIDQGAELVVGDLGERADVHAMIERLTASDPLDAVIHNAGVQSGRAVMAVNLIAPYLLTVGLNGPSRLVYLSSGMHRGGRASALDGIDWTAPGSYSDSKLFVTALAAAVARPRPDVFSNAVDPGWVPTRMGGRGAPDDLEEGYRTQAWLATSDDPEARTSGGYWHHHRRQDPHPAVHDKGFQDRLLESLAHETGQSFGTAPSCARRSGG